MKQAICKFFLKLLGWKAMDPPIDAPKGIILGVPHTSVWDFIISWLYYNAIGGKSYCMVKKEFFWGPLAPVMRWMTKENQQQRETNLQEQAFEKFRQRVAVVKRRAH